MVTEEKQPPWPQLVCSQELVTRMRWQSAASSWLIGGSKENSTRLTEEGF